MEPSVVVSIKCSVFKHVNDGVIAVRFAPFGLTAYGDTEEESFGEFKKLFNRFITGYRNKGKLADVLTRSAVDWHWERDHRTEQGDYEHTDSESSASAALVAERVATMKGSYGTAWKIMDVDIDDRDFAVAA